MMATAMAMAMARMMAMIMATATSLMVMRMGMGQHMAVTHLQLVNYTAKRITVRWQQQLVGQQRCFSDMTINLPAKDERRQLTKGGRQEMEKTRGFTDGQRRGQQKEEALMMVIMTW